MVITCLLGSVFSAMFFYWNVPISKEHATVITATFEKAEFFYGSVGRTSLQDVMLFFTDTEQQCLDGTCVDQTLRDELKTMKRGTELTMRINERNGCVVELKTDTKELLSFDTAQEKLKNEGISFFCLGICLYGMTAYFGYHAFIVPLRRKGVKHKKG